MHINHTTFITDSNGLLLIGMVSPHVNIMAANATACGVAIYSLITL